MNAESIVRSLISRWNHMGSTVKQHPIVFATVFVRSGKVLYTAENITTQQDLSNTSMIWKDNEVRFHAELLAILGRTAWGMVVVRFNPDGTFGDAKPCIVCMAAIKKTKLQYVWYSNSDGTIGKIGVV
jgi:tRNA(Arg) A34 adenosine deaminase TadA